MSEALWNTVSLAVVRQQSALVIGVPLSWLIARTDLPWKKALEFVFWISFFFLPLPVTRGWILFLTAKFGLLNQSAAEPVDYQRTDFQILFLLGHCLGAHDDQPRREKCCFWCWRIFLLTPSLEESAAQLRRSIR